MIHQRPLSYIASRSLLLLALCALPFAAHAQSATATLSGTVVDQNGAAVPGTAITVLNAGTSLQREATTNDGGNFTVPLLSPGTYTVSARRDGFAPLEIPSVILNVGDQKALKIELKAGDINAEVQVVSEASLISESPAVATTIDRQFVGNLPLNGRTFQSLILLTPGIVYTPPDFNNPGEFSVNGQRANANYFTVDGVGANVAVTFVAASQAITSNAMAGMLPGLGASGSTSALVSIDALEEFKIQTSTYSAQYGRQPGGQVQLVTRSGGNQFHGTLFEYLRNEAFDARSYFNKKPAPEPPTRQNQFGGTFSGPVFLPRFGEGGPGWYNGKDRTFFFFSYEGQRLRLPVNAVFAVPSLRLRQHNMLSPALRQVLNAFPLPTGDEVLADMDNNPTTPPTGSGGAPFLTAYSNPKSQDATSIRIDHRISSKHTIFGRFNYAPSNSLTRTLAQLAGGVVDARTLTIGTTSSLTARLSNEFRFNYTRNSGTQSGRLDNFGGAVPIDVSALLTGYTGEPSGVQGRFFLQTTAGFGEIFIGDPINNRQQQYNFVDNIFWTTGVHQLSFGFDFRRLAPTFGPLQYQQAAAAFILSGAEETNFLNGIISSVGIRTQGTAVRPRFDNFSAYIHDSWKASHRLTLDFGLRWEFNPTPTEASGRKPLFVVGVENLATARLARPDEAWYKTFYTAFAPRFGVAYQLNQKAGQETVLRGGFGVYYNLNSGLATAGYSGFPFIVGKTLTNVQWPLTPAQAALPAQPSVTLPITNELRAINPDLKLPYALQWNASAEQAFGNLQTVTISYVGSAGRQLTTNERLNQPINSFLDPRPNPNFGDIHYVTNGPTSDYHAMQAQYQRRLSHGLQTLVNYTWSHAIDEVSNEIEQGTLVRGNASFDVRHNFSAALTYEVPRWKRFSMVDAILRDWSIDTALLAYSGQPLDITLSGSVANGDGKFIVVRPDLVPGVPLWIDDPNAPGGRKINRDAFARPPAVPNSFNSRYLRMGTLGRNVVRAPGIQQVNLAIRRQFNFFERWNLQLRAEAFNLFNTPVLAGYNTVFSPTSTIFGRASTTLNNRSNASNTGLNSLYALGGPRSMQFSIRLSF